MNISFSSFMTTILFSSIMMLLLYFLSKSTQHILKLGIQFIFLYMFLILLKLLFPIEFSFTHSVYLEKILPTIFQWFNTNIVKIGNFGISLNFILGTIWGIGASFLSVKLIVSYYKISYAIKKIKPVNNPLLQKNLDKINKDYKKNKEFHLVSSEYISTPFIFGIKTPYIALPEINLEEKEWYYILSHEISHYYHKDLIIKLIIELISVVYWWNPLFYLLKGQFYKMIEIDTDRRVTKRWEKEQKLEYLHCLIHLEKKTKIIKVQKLVTTFKSNNVFILSQRIHLVIDDLKPPKKTQNFYKLLFVLFFMSLLFFPVFYILEPSYVTPEVERESFEINPENAFFIKISDTCFELYVNNEYVVTVHEIFDPRIKIYSKEDLLDNKEK